MADEFDNSEEADAAEMSAYDKEMANARAQDDQVRFQATVDSAKENLAAQETSANAQAGAGMGAASAASVGLESPLAKLGEASSLTTRWVTNLPENIGIGLMDAAVSSATALWDGLRDSLVDAGDYGDEESTGAAILGDKTFKAVTPPPADSPDMTPAQRREVSDQRDQYQTEQMAQPTPLDRQVGQAYDAWRAELTDDSNMADLVTQGAAQFMIPFVGYSKAFGVARNSGLLKNVLRLGAAEAVTAGTVLAPESGRAADLIQLGREAEGRFGDLMRAASPDGTLQNQYIEWMVDRAGESNLEARYKNTVDSLGISAALGTIFKVAGTTFKTGRKIAADIAEKRAERAFNDEMADAMMARKAGVKPVKGGFEETHSGLVFEKDKDAANAVEELAHRFGNGFEERIAGHQASASDKNFATLHSFSKVVRMNGEKPVRTHSLVAALERNLKGDTEKGAFYKELLGRLKAKNLGGVTLVTETPSAGRRLAGKYNTKTDHIDLFSLAFDTPERLLHTFTHEAVHAATTREMRESAKVSAQMERLREQAEKALNAANEPEMASRRAGNAPGPLPHDLKVQDQYGFKNAEEFVAEIESNPEFRKEMMKVKIGDESAWDKYLKTIAGILGVGALAINPEFSKLMDPKQEEVTE